MATRDDEVPPDVPVGLPTRYRLIRRIGAGRSATVWLARDSRIGSNVAVKVIRSSYRTPDACLGELILERFEREVRSLVRLSGTPGICRVLQLGVDTHSTPWLVTEYLPGGPLSDATVPLSAGDCRQLFSALASAHALGVVHGDISPNNILFDSADSPVLVDFGMAGIDVANSRAPVGGWTPAFAAPETVRGARPSPASDVYALAATLDGHVVASDKSLRRVFEAAMVADPTKRPPAAKIVHHLR